MTKEIISRLKIDYPDLVFTVGSSYCWSPKGKEIFYTISDEASSTASILHEIGHARLGHISFVSDLELVQKELDAWEEAQRLARHYGVEIDQDHIQDCLDSYRDWLYKRSQCPSCKSAGVQRTANEYMCVNCGTFWSVTNSRLKRPYRLKKATPEK